MDISRGLNSVLQTLAIAGVLLGFAESCDIGTANPSSHTANNGTSTTGISFFIDGVPSSCCGNMANFKFYQNDPGNVTVMLWRPTTGNNYDLVYMEEVTGKVGLNVKAPNVTVPVEIGDVVGWRTDGNELIPYSDTAGSTQSQLLTPVLNNQFPWGNTPDTTKTYAFGAVVDPNELPTITGGSETIAITETSQTVHFLDITDKESTEPLTNLTVEISATSPTTSEFTIADDGTNFVIQSGSTLTPGTYELEVTVTDTCDGVASATVTITVENTLPIITNLGGTVGPLSDINAVGTSIHQFTVTDIDDVVTCTVDSPDFNVTKLDNAPGTQIFDVGVVSLNEDTDSFYPLIFTCNGGIYAAIDTLNVTVYDEVPTQTGLDFTAATIADGTQGTTALGTFTVDDANDVGNINCVIDAPNDSNFTLTTVSTTSTTVDIELTTTAGVALFADDSPYLVVITCTDDEATNIVSGTATIPVSNALPFFNPTPDTSYSGSLSDATINATFIYAFSVSDSDPITCTTNNPKFEIIYSAPNHEIWLVDNADLNYNTTTEETMTITCTDGTTNITTDYSVPIFDELPVITNLGGASIGPLSDIHDVGTSIYQFTVTDQDDIVTCTVDSPDFNVTKLDNGPGTQIFDVGVVSLNEDTDPNYTLNFTCNDGENDVVDTLGVTVYDEVPTQTGLNFTATPIADGIQGTTSLGTFTVEDANDVSNIDCNIASPNNSSFTLSTVATTSTTVDIELTTTAGVTLYAADSPYEVVITCTDDEATNIVSGTATVPLINTPPFISNLPGNAQISESETTLTSIFTLLCSDATECNCYLSDTVLAGGLFYLNNPVVTLPTTDYDVNVWHTKGLDFEENAGVLSVDITCGDTNSTTEETLTIDILNAAPVITNGGGSVTISEDETGFLKIKQILFEEFDATDADCTMTDDDGCGFDVDADNVIVKLAGALDFENKPECNLVMACTDGLLTTFDTLTITVGNKGPEIMNFPTAVVIPEEQVAEVALMALQLSENATDCSQVAPAEPEYVVKYEPSTSEWNLYYVSQAVAGKKLNFKTKPVYPITVVCEDADGEQGTPKTIVVHVVDNEEPVFDNIGGQVTTMEELTAKQFAASDIVYTLEATDPTGDPITYSMLSCEPSATCPFSVSPNGDIVTSEDLHSHGNEIYKLQVRAADDYNLDAPPAELILKINDINTIPTFEDLPRRDKIGVKENQHAAGDSVYQMTVVDPDTTDTVEIFCVFPDGGDEYFECDPATGDIIAKKAINYEEVSQLEYRAVIYAFDGYAESALHEVTISINDENEPPMFNKLQWTITSPDEGGPGQEIGCPDFEADIDDEDTNDIHTYTMDCPAGNGFFVMDKFTGCVTMLREWDLDDNAKRLGVDVIPCTVTATDKRGLVTTADLDLEINESDDNQPYLDQTSYILCADVGTSSGVLTSQVDADDDDVLALHREHTYEFIGGSNLFATDGNGQLTYGDVSGYSKGTTFETTLRATDDAGNYDDSPVTIMICDPPTAAAAASAASASASSSSSSTSDLLWLIPLILLSLLLLGLAAYLLRRFCCAGRCACLNRCCSCFRTRTRVVRAAKPVQAVRVVKAKPVQAVRVVKTQPTRVVAKTVKVTTPIKTVQTPVKTVVTPVKPVPQGLPTLQDLPMHNFWAREVGNTGFTYPKS